MTLLGFEYPWILAGLLLLPTVMLLRRYLGRVDVLLVPYASVWQPRCAVPRRDNWVSLAYTALVLLNIAAARPQYTHEQHEVTSRGYDLVLAVDLSTSMLAEDYGGSHGAINRLEAIRPIIKAFVAGRPADRIAVVVFAGRAYTLSPLTTDHGWLQKQLSSLKIGEIEDGTAIGDGIGIALTHLESHGDDPAVGSFIVLLTDGANTGGLLTPPQATLIAQHRKIPIFTIGAGRDGLVPYPVFDSAGHRTGTRRLPFGTDEESLRTIARATGGEYFKADDVAAVQSAFADIDRAEKTRFRSRTVVATHELFYLALLPAVALLLYLQWRGGGRPLPAVVAS
jgi:Ca-activated chloride channel family protein